MPKENEINTNNATTEQAVASSSKQITSTEITENIDKIIAENEKISIVSSSESKKNLEKETRNDEIFHMKKSEKEKLGENFSGLDKILYDRIEKKINETEINKHVGAVFAGTFIPLIGSFVSTAVLSETSEFQQKRLVISFSTEEVKEIIEELGITKISENTELLKKTRRQILDLEKTAKQEIQKKNKEIESTKNQEIKSLTEKEQEISNIKEKRDKVQFDLNTLKTYERYLEKEIRAEKEEKEKYQQRESQLKREIQDLTNQLTNFKNKEQEWEAQKQEIEQLKEENNNLSEQLNSLRIGIKNTDGLLELIKMERNDLKVALQEKAAEYQIAVKIIAEEQLQLDEKKTLETKIEIPPK